MGKSKVDEQPCVLCKQDAVAECRICGHPFCKRCLEKHRHCPECGGAGYYLPNPNAITAAYGSILTPCNVCARTGLTGKRATAKVMKHLDRLEEQCGI